MGGEPPTIAMKQSVARHLVHEECEPITVPVTALALQSESVTFRLAIPQGSVAQAFQSTKITMSNLPTSESRFRRMTGVRSVWSPGSSDNLQNEHSPQDETDDLDAGAVGERHKRRHEDISSPDGPHHTTSQADLEEISRVANRNDLPSDNQSPEGESFPKKIGTNEWLYADGRVYKKLMFVIRKDQSEALDVALASGRPKLGEDRSEIVRNLLDHAGINGGGEATHHLDQ